MNEPNPEIKPDESTIRRRVDIACDGEQRSLPPKWLASEERGKKVQSGWMEQMMSIVIFQLKVFAWIYIFGSIVTFSILVFLFMDGRLHFHFNNANCAMECFTNPLAQSISNLLEQHREYKSYYDKYIILQDNYTTQTIQLVHAEEEKNNLTEQLKGTKQEHKTYYEKYLIIKDNYTRKAKELVKIEKENKRLIKQSGETDKDWRICNRSLNTYKKYLEFIGSIDKRIKKMDTCYSYVQTYCTCLGEHNQDCATSFLEYLGCKDALPSTYYDKIKVSYSKLLSEVIMVKKNLTSLLVTGNFKVMQQIYEQQKYLPVDNCLFICSLDVEDLDKQFNTTSWKTFQDGWQFFKKFFLN